MGDMTEQEAEQILRQMGEGKANLHTFMTKVIQSSDTTKTGNLNEEELGASNLPVRTYKELELFAKDIAGQEDFSEYFKKMSEIQTSTSLSKDAILIKLATTIRKELADVTQKPKSKNKGWFKSKNNGD